MKKLTSYSIISIILIGIAVLIFWFFRYQYIPSSDILITPYADSAFVEKEIPRAYGIAIDSFNIEYGKIGKNQTLGNILKQYTLPEKALQNLISIPRDVFDLRKLRAGYKYAIFLEKDSAATLKYFVYEENLVDFVMLNFSPDTIIVSRASKPVTKSEKKISGTIQSSLWNAMIEKSYDPLLANDLSEIYAWSIDFFGLQQGDSFAMVIDQIYVDTLYVGYENVKAAYFYHSGAEFFAIPFEQGKVVSFYDADGNSLRKTFLKAPLKYSRVSSGFSYSRMHPILKIRRPHLGVDYAAPSGTPVYAIGDGKIIKAAKGYNNGAGNMIKIKHNSVYTTAYIHLRGFAKGIKVGTFVKQGDLIGYVGSTGLSTGPHLDFRFYKNGKAIDPLKVKAEPVEPIHDTNKVQFEKVKKGTIQLLNH